MSDKSPYQGKSINLLNNSSDNLAIESTTKAYHLIEYNNNQKSKNSENNQTLQHVRQNNMASNFNMFNSESNVEDNLHKKTGKTHTPISIGMVNRFTNQRLNTINEKDMPLPKFSKCIIETYSPSKYNRNHTADSAAVNREIANDSMVTELGMDSSNQKVKKVVPARPGWHSGGRHIEKFISSSVKKVIESNSHVSNQVD